MSNSTTKPNLIAAYVYEKDTENIAVKIMLNDDLSATERYYYLTTLIQKLQPEADKARAEWDREQRRMRAIERTTPKRGADTQAPSASSIL